MGWARIPLQDVLMLLLLVLLLGLWVLVLRRGLVLAYCGAKRTRTGKVSAVGG